MSGAPRTADIAAAIAYHDRTKHDFNRSARGPGYMDWANQPDPFRRYAGAPRFLLPFETDDGSPRYEALYTGVLESQPLTVKSLAQFFEYSLAVSASKAAGESSWKLRCNPSSGNLHPTEGYVMVPGMDGLGAAPSVYHYCADDHALEQRCTFSGDLWSRLTKGLPPGTFFAGLSTVHWREAWKYGERAYRYCNHDAGHALAAMRFSAAALGWRSIVLDGLGSDDISALLGLDRVPGDLTAEREHPEMMIGVLTQREAVTLSMWGVATDVVEAVSRAQWSGEPNVLSQERIDWAIIEETAAACFKPRTESSELRLHSLPRPDIERSANAISANTICLQRRSAVDMDGVSTMSLGDFYASLERTIPRAGRPPFDAWPYAPEVHLGMFVHRVDGLSPGVYVLVRNTAHFDSLKHAMRPEFVWTAPPERPPDLPLYHLASADCRGLAAQVSCQQAIAGDGAFSLGMIARFEPALREYGAWYYPRLFWETGMIGQALYLEAEASGLRATGIGCYFDDPVHRVFGLSGREFQSLYHFTVGGPVDDPRLTSLPPYTPERRKQRGWV